MSLGPRWRVLCAAAVLAGTGVGVAAAASHATAAPAVRLDRIPAHMLPSSAPVPFSPGLIRVSDDWLVSDGDSLVAVYAGSVDTEPGTGRFVIVRQEAQTGRQTVTVVNVPGSGAVAIIHPPVGAVVETSAQHGDLAFKTASGGVGALHLSSSSTSEG